MVYLLLEIHQHAAPSGAHNAHPTAETYFLGNISITPSALERREIGEKAR